MIEHYFMVVSPSQMNDLLHPPTAEEMARWDLEEEWDNMIGEEE